jgi:hypothetical protein
MAECVNVPRAISIVVSSRLATLVDLDSVLGASDLYDLLEIITVDAYNRREASKNEE